ncbi:MAG: L,D-transpeptidase family protein [Gammaproteobacteria bacterium]|nr:L,D-transpeptidase family protein [Gammaproteobacteria bacterium]
MYFRTKSTQPAVAGSTRVNILLCLALLIPVTNLQAVGFSNLEEDFYSYSPLGSQIKSVFDNKKYVAVSSHSLDWAQLRKFYRARGFSPAWCRSDDHGYSVDLLLGYLAISFQEGLNPDDYEITPNVSNCHQLNDEKMAKFDIALTNAFFKYSKDVHSGRLDPHTADEEWHIPQVKFNPIKTLEAALKNNNLKETISNLPPQHNAYKLLRTTLEKYREIANNQSWPQIPSGRALTPGTTHPHIPLVRRRLAGELENGQLHYGSNDQIYDNQLQLAVESFQKRHGLAMDGAIGPGTRRAMNISADERIRQIVTSMERWRWMPRSMGNQYVLVNVPGFQLEFIKNNQSVLNMRTIIGRKDRSSPSFMSSITQVVFNPTWTAPQSIAVKDLLPQQQKDPNFFDSQNIEVFMRNQGSAKFNPYDIDWHQFDEEYFPYMLRQTPGPHNSLGRIKFQSFNKHGIFLHDTPYRPLFKKRVRAFSSGCIRLEKPEQLAATLLGDSYNPTPESANKVIELIETKETIEHDLNEKVPVYLIYMTAWVDKNGVVQFRPDIYQRDHKISRSLTGSGVAG